MMDNVDEVAEKRVAVLRNIEKEKLRVSKFNHKFGQENIN
jgi:hypothetical protein